MTPTSAAATLTSDKPRYHAMDSLRAVAMLLGIVIHALQAYAMMNFRPGSGSPGGIWLAEFIHAWRMPLFFLISGFFCRMMFHRYGPALYLKRRWQRIGIPLVLGLLTVSPLFVFTQEQVNRLQARPSGQSSANGNRRSGPPREDMPNPQEILRKFDADKNGRINEEERRAVEDYFQKRFGFVPPPPGEEVEAIGDGGPRRPGSRVDSTKGERLREGPGQSMQWVFRQFGGFIRTFRWFGLHYLWFLWYLILFVVAGPIVAWGVGRVAATRTGQVVERWGERALNCGFAVVLLAVVTVPLLWAQGGWSLKTSQALLLPFPLFALLPDASILGFYFAYFLGGWFVHRHVGALTALGGRWSALTFMGVAAYFASRVVAGDLPPGPQPSAVGADPSQRLAVLSLYSLSTALLVFGLMGFFQRFFDRPSARWRYASDATFWLYLAHQPLLLVLQAGFTHLPGPWFVQVPLIVLLVTTVLLVVYHFGVRDKFIGRILNGPRERSASVTAPLLAGHQYQNGTSMKTLLTRCLWRLLVGLLLVGAALSLARFAGGRTSAGEVSYRTAVVSRDDVIQSVTANGELAAVKTVQVGCQVSGMIKELLVDYNSVVTNGQVIARLDPATFQQNLAQADAELATAKAALELAEVNFRRAEALHKDRLISESEFDKTGAELSQSRANLKMKEALLGRARVDLERTTITAPIDGVVITRNVSVGQTVAANFNTPTLFLIANDLRKMRIETKVSEADVGGVKTGQPVSFTVDAFPERTFTGQVTMVRYAASIEQNVVNYTTLVEVNNDDLELRPTMTANATIITRQARQVLRVPNAALRFAPPAGAWLAGVTNASTTSEVAGARTVYVATARDENGRVRTQLQPVSVKTGITDGSFTEIVEGVAEDQKVVTAALTPTRTKPSSSAGSVFLTGGRGRGGGGPPQ